MKVTPKELQTVVLKLQIALKKILTSKRSNKDESRKNKDQEKENSQPQKRVVLVNSLESPEKQQEVIKIEDSKVVVSQKVTYLFCDWLKYRFKSAYGQSQTSDKRCY